MGLFNRPLPSPPELQLNFNISSVMTVPAAGSVRFKRLKVDQPVGNKFFQILGRDTQTTTSRTAPPPMDSFMHMGVM